MSKKIKLSLKIGLGAFLLFILTFSFAYSDSNFSAKNIIAAASRIGQLDRSIMSSISVNCEANSPKAILSWTPVANATSYVLAKKSPNSVGWPQIAKISDTSYRDISFSAGPGLYEYQVKAITPGYRPSYSNIEIARVLSCDGSLPPPLTPTSTPTSNNQPTTTPVTQTKPTPSPTPTSTPVTPKPANPTTVPQISTKKEWGAYVGWRETDMATFESQVGKIVKYQAVFVHWGNENLFPLYLKPTVADKNKSLIIFWEATDYNADSIIQPRFGYDAILNGEWNSYISKFAADAKAYGGEVIIIPFSEMNGNWFGWGGVVGTNTADKHIKAFRYLKNYFKDIPNVKFGWAPNADSVPDTTANQLEKYYPGDDYVDYVGVDGFNFSGPWMTFDQVFSKPLAKLKTYNKPIFIFSFASAEGANKANWITDALTVQIPKHPEIKAWVWFNERKERDWRVWSDPTALDAFKKAVQTL